MASSRTVPKAVLRWIRANLSKSRHYPSVGQFIKLDVLDCNGFRMSG